MNRITTETIAYPGKFSPYAFYFQGGRTSDAKEAESLVEQSGSLSITAYKADVIEAPDRQSNLLSRTLHVAGKGLLSNGGGSV